MTIQATLVWFCSALICNFCLFGVKVDGQKFFNMYYPAEHLPLGIG